MAELTALVSRLAARGGQRTEADIQSDVRSFLLTADLNLHAGQVKLEAPTGDGTRRRLDVEAGLCVVEVKRDLRKGNVLTDAVTQLAGYVHTRTVQMGRRYVGVLTDGADWRLYTLGAGRDLVQVSTLTVTGATDDAERLEVWLEAVLSTTTKVLPTPEEITAQLGASSPAFRLDYLDIERMYAEVASTPEVVLKRSLWAKLLTTALGTQFDDDTSLFVEHTYLVTVAELVAHAVAGFRLDDPTLSARTLVSGEAFRAANITGVVESDFFDWLLHANGGEALISDLARRIARFDWSSTAHDVLKVLYESVIGSEQRHSLGEYYTPDWLADRIVRDVVPNPLTTTVLDPSCGSGTFVFHAVKNYLAAADDRGHTIADTLNGVTSSVYGMDVHPVAVTLARVTYLLALGTTRLQSPHRPALNIPVFLGDALQWEQSPGVLGSAGLSIPTDDDGSLFVADLRFPDSVMGDATRFDQLVTRLTDMATGRTAGAPIRSLRAVFNQFAVPDADEATLTETFALMCRLHDSGRNHIWGYYVRNLARPLWLHRDANRVDALIGNPPWLSYRYMPPQMQQRFKDATQARGMWAGAKVATHQDLSAYFVARTAELYLTSGGTFGFVMPFAVLSRLAYDGFRTGALSTPTGAGVELSFGEAWDLHRVKPDPFPVPCSVVFGRLTPQRARPLGSSVLQWSGKLDAVTVDWDTAKGSLTTGGASVQVATTDGERSPYAARFTQGANLVPRMLICVVPGDGSPLGAGAGRQGVRSARSGLEKKPWKDLPDQTGVVERPFVYPVHLGSTTLPYRLMEPWHAVLPITQGHLLGDEGDPAPLDAYPDLAAWWRSAEHVWQSHRSSSTTLSLLEQVDYHGKLSKQFPAPPYRVVYSASGTNLAAATVTNPRAVIEHKLYWAPAASLEEARYLTAILNSDALLTRIQGLQSRGQFGARDFDSYVFAVPFPAFDSGVDLHLHLAVSAARAEDVAASVLLPDGVKFQRARKMVRAELAELGVAAHIESLVEELFATLAAPTEY